MESFYDRCLWRICCIFQSKKKSPTKDSVEELAARMVTVSWNQTATIQMARSLTLYQLCVPEIALRLQPPGKRKPWWLKTTHALGLAQGAWPYLGQSSVCRTRRGQVERDCCRLESHRGWRGLRVSYFWCVCPGNGVQTDGVPKNILQYTQLVNILGVDDSGKLGLFPFATLKTWFGECENLLFLFYEWEQTTHFRHSFIRFILQCAAQGCK